MIKQCCLCECIQLHYCSPATRWQHIPTKGLGWDLCSCWPKQWWLKSYSYRRIYFDALQLNILRDSELIIHHCILTLVMQKKNKERREQFSEHLTHMHIFYHNPNVSSGHVLLMREVFRFIINSHMKHFLSRCIWNVFWPMLSWTSALPTGSALFWEPSCWLPRFGMTRLCGMLTTVRSSKTSQWRTCECIFCKFEKSSNTQTE